jgi:translation initiation factor 2 subunit 3
MPANHARASNNIRAVFGEVSDDDHDSNDRPRASGANSESDGDQVAERTHELDPNGEIEHTEGLATQSLMDLHPDKISPLLPQIMSRQATINIGSIGHVAHGKSTVVKAISDVRTMQYRKEAAMNLTIHLGYANAKIFKCPSCPAPDCYSAFGSRQPDATVCPKCDTLMTLQRHVSFVDCPGHDILMATMLNGAAIMDAALLLVAANELFPQPQTLEHLKAVEIMRLQSVIVLQNKIDLVKGAAAQEQHASIKAYLKNTSAMNSPIVPISAQMKYNIDVVLEYICHVPVPRRRFDVPLRMIVVRSFDVNKPGEDVAKLTGGVAGGSVLEGVLKLGQEIEVRPGLRMRSQDASGESVLTCQPIRSRAKTLSSEKISLLYAIPGGLIGVGTNIDPALTRQNKLVGNLVGAPGTLPDVYSDVEVEYNLFTQLVGVKSGAGKAVKVAKLAESEALQINVGSLTTAGVVVAVQSNVVRIRLMQPVCARVQTSVAVSRRFENHWRLIGWGRIVRGVPVPLK